MLEAKHWFLATAESCTGGLIAVTCTDLAGSSQWFERGFVTYSNEAKTDLLGVPPELIAEHGAVSQPVALAVTGVAGPGGGSALKPVGTVWFAWATPAGIESEMCRFAGDRAAVRQATVRHALARLVELIG